MEADDENADHVHMFLLMLLSPSLSLVQLKPPPPSLIATTTIKCRKSSTTNCATRMGDDRGDDRGLSQWWQVEFLQQPMKDSEGEGRGPGVRDADASASRAHVSFFFLFFYTLWTIISKLDYMYVVIMIFLWNAMAQAEL